MVKYYENAAANGIILLNDIEKKIFKTLKDVCEHFGFKTTMRVAGGWVRDKLLKKESNDIDIALDDMTGYAFSLQVRNYVHEVKSDKNDVVSISKIKSNPDKSKHLETVRFKLHGLEIDVNNLRTETYTEDSRIPQVQIGTPQQDASRRDLTINAMFYNINDDVIEDWLDTGFDDLKEGIIRTPLSAFDTFCDDPLRILRTARFASRFGYNVTDDIKAAARNHEVRKKLYSKVSFERVGDEVLKILASNDPILGFTLLCREFQLYDLIFRLPISYHPHDITAPFPYFPVSLEHLSYEDISEASLSIMKVILNNLKDKGYTREERRFLLLAAFLSPLWGYVTKEGRQNQWEKTTIVYHVIVKSLKRSVSLSRQVIGILRAGELFLQISREWIQAGLEQYQLPLSKKRRLHDEDLPELRIQSSCEHFEILDPVPDAIIVKMGRALKVVKKHWDHCFDLCDALASHFHAFIIPRFLPSALMKSWVCDSQIFGCWNWKPLIDGRELVSLYNLSGQAIGQTLKVIEDWRYLHPNSSVDECRQFLDSKIVSVD